MPALVSDGAAKQLLSDHPWRFGVAICKRADCRDGKMVEQSRIDLGSGECTLEGPNHALRVRGRRLFSNHLKQGRRVDFMPVHRPSLKSQSAASIGVCLGDCRVTRP